MCPGRVGLASFMDKVCGREGLASFMDKVCVREGLASFMDKVCGPGRVGIVHG